ncbi:MAG: MscL family protein, partial [Gemmatimonadota bacterium]
MAAPYATLAVAREAGAVTLNYGVFINAIISFLIVAFSVFLVVRSFNKLKKQEEAPSEAPAPPAPLQRGGAPGRDPGPPEGARLTRMRMRPLRLSSGAPWHLSLRVEAAGRDFVCRIGGGDAHVGAVA